MQKVWLVAALAVPLALAACGGQSSPTYNNSSGSAALSRDDTLVYAVDTDNEILAVVDAASQQKIAEVKLGRAPETVVVAPDDTLYVANRGGRSVSVVHKGVWEEAARIPVGVEPVGLAVAPNGKTLYVVNSTSLESAEYGTLTAVDTRSNQVKWDLPLGEEPRSIALIEDGTKALITLYKKGDVLKVDLTGPTILRDNTQTKVMGETGLLRFKANESRLTDDGTGFAYRYSAFHPRSASTITASPDGQRAFMTLTWAREDDIAALPNAGGGYYASGGPCSIGAVATAGLATFDREGEPQVDDLTACAFRGQDEGLPFPSTTLGRIDPNHPALQGSTATVVDPTGSWLFIVSREGKNVAITPTSRRGGDDLAFLSTGTTVRDQVPVGAGANGIAITRDGKTVYVYNQFDHTLSVLTERVSTDGRSTVQNARTIRVATALPESVMPQDVQLGRALFFDATDPQINDPRATGVSCNTCHTEGGREDGHVWGFPDGKRQTPALVGRMLSKTAPFHWSGEFATLKAFLDHTAVLRMGGTGLSPERMNQLIAFIDYAPGAENPNKGAQLTAQQLRGAQLFTEARCGACHGGEALTLNTMENVGTITNTDLVNVSLESAGTPMTLINTPSLLGLARTAPYLHDGSALTLKARLQQSGDQHGVTSQLTGAQVDDLVAYLNTL